MKAEFGELKNGFGEAKLFPENTDDLWHLKHLVSWGNRVYAVTFRSVDTAQDKLRPEKAEKKPVRIGIKAEKIEFHKNSNRLRITGVIEYGPDEGSYHTLNVEPQYEISVVRHWSALDRERIDRAVKASTCGVIHVAAVEEGEAEIYRIRQYGPEFVKSVLMGSGKTEGLNTKEEFFEEISAILKATTASVVIAGPGFIKDDFAAFVKRKDADLARRILTVETRRIGRGAVMDVIGQGILDKITEDLQLKHEILAMEELIKRISQDGNAAYGPKQVADAVNLGAAEKVLVCDTLLRDRAVSDMLETAEHMRSEIVVLSTEFDTGKQLEALGGTAALLRYKI